MLWRASVQRIHLVNAVKRTNSQPVQQQHWIKTGMKGEIKKVKSQVDQTLRREIDILSKISTREKK